MKNQRKADKKRRSKTKRKKKATVLPSAVAALKELAKHPGGRPPKYATPEELLAAASAYFVDCVEHVAIPNKAGLFLALDISRECWSEYRKKYSDAVKRIEDCIEDAWVQRLRSNAPTGAI